MRGLYLPVRHFDGLTVAELPAEIDVTNSDDVRDTLLALLNWEPSGLVADMSGTSFCDASGARAVVRAHRRAQALGTQLSVVITHPVVLRVFKLSGADAMLRIYPALGEALALHDTDADNLPGRPPAAGAPRIPRPQAPRPVTHPMREALSAQRGT